MNRPIQRTFKAAVEAFGEASATEPPALALEVFISADVFGVSVPRAVKPARSRADARSFLAMIEDIVGDAALDRVGDVDVTALRPEIYYTPGLHTDSGAAGGGGGGGIQLDATLQLFMAALEEQAAGRGHEPNKRARTKKRKGKRRR